MPGWIRLGDEPELYLSNAPKRIGERRRKTWIEKKAGPGVFSRLIIGIDAAGGVAGKLEGVRTRAVRNRTLSPNEA
ncbi:hypothetical protein [Agrobacterium sp. DSM 25558]|uniref:hypothetical protein n=1 Tax=Agrobacterium sp. DSM 25558 TaxID=1907665 RepID=UPI00097D9E5D|nr:hypothetical protein [Agrobacterium sp. DSM 25558]